MKEFFSPGRWLAIGLAGLSLNSVVLAIDPAALQRSLTNGEPITIVDIRSLAQFQQDHIAGAINVPAALVPEKKLPALGKVVVCDEGLGRDTATAVVAELNQRNGISAEVLEGGFAGWKALQGGTTKARGLHPEELNMMTYDQLKRANPDEVVLVDLRKPAPQQRQDGNSKAAPASPLTDLSKEFPNAPVTKSAFKLPQLRQDGSKRGVEPVRVLIDDGDGSAQEMARTLKANGITRVVILAGGESILSRHGQPGLQRMGVNQNAIKPIINNAGSR